MALPSSQSSIRQLREQLIGSQIPSADRCILQTPFSTLDALLPQNGIPTGSLIEWVSDADGIRTTTIAMKCAARFLKQAGAMVVIDPLHEFHAASAAHLGVPVERLLLVRPQGVQSSERYGLADSRRTESLWALEQAARCSGVRIVFTWIDRISSTAQRRLQLAVERSGVTVFLIRPALALRQNSWADLRFYVQPAAGIISGRQIAVRLTRSKNALLHHGAALLEYDDETGDVSEVPELARAATAARTLE